jgi:hypothetical protein
MGTGERTSTPGYLPGGGTIEIVGADPNTGRVQLTLPGGAPSPASEILAVEVSTKPLINFVWLGAIVMLASAALSMIRRFGELKERPARTSAGQAA